MALILMSLTERRTNTSAADGQQILFRKQVKINPSFSRQGIDRQMVLPQTEAEPYAARQQVGAVRTLQFVEFDRGREQPSQGHAKLEIPVKDCFRGIR